MRNQRNGMQLLWGAALTIAGVGVFVILPVRMKQIAQMRQAELYSLDMLFLWFCFGLLGLLLIGGGLRKIFGLFKAPADPADSNQDQN